MKNLIKVLFLLVVTALLATGSDLARAENLPVTISIDAAGSIKLGGVKVVQVAGTTFYARTTWGNSFIRYIIKTDSDTVFTRHFGGPAVVGEVVADHFLNLEGYLDASSDTISIKAKTIQNLSLNDEKSAFSGKVKSLNLANSQFTLTDKTKGDITVALGSDTSIIRNGRVIDRSILKVGDTITKADGTYDIPKKILTAKNLEVYLNRSMFWPKNFQGVLRRLDSTTLPTQATIAIAGTDYTVKLPTDILILDNKKNKTKLGRYLEGDTVRVYGAIQEDDFSLIIAEVIRNIDL
ncbi:MAG: hypothetical protein WCT25_00510 [Candidatus Paceibacterota bacterium]|jgi:hypothetical protein